MLRMDVKGPPKGAIARQGVKVAAAQRKAIHNAVDRASKIGQRMVQQKMKAAGLGRLPNAVGHTSSRKKGRLDQRTAWGVIFARGGDESRAGGALEAYSRGAGIKPRNTEWLWYETKAIPRRVGRRRITPALYNRSGVVTSIGPHQFRRISAGRAQLFIRNVSLSPKTGRAKAMGKRKTRTRIPVKEIVAFVGIKWTRRAKRFDQNQIMEEANKLVPVFIPEEMEGLLSRTG